MEWRVCGIKITSGEKDLTLGKKYYNQDWKNPPKSPGS